MLIMKPCPGIRVQKIYIPSGARRIPALLLSPVDALCPTPTGVLWLHGGGYAVGHEGDGICLPRSRVW